MATHELENGFTIAEMIVTLVIMGLFLTLFFNTFMSSEYQRVAVSTRATANDISLTNLGKISSKTTITLPACNSTASSPNNLIANSAATGSYIATDDATLNAAPTNAPTWTAAGLKAEVLTDTSLQTGTTQTLKVLYPRGCGSAMPAQIISIVNYKSETVSHATYVN